MKASHTRANDAPLSELIPPDRRRLKSTLLVVASMCAGAALLAGGRYVVNAIQLGCAPTASTTPQPPPSQPGYAERLRAAARAANEKAAADAVRKHATLEATFKRLEAERQYPRTPIDCSSPVFIDERGVRRYRLECLD